MASSRVQEHRNVNPTKPAALTKAVPRCVPATDTGCHSVLSDVDITRRTRRGAREDGKQGGQAAKGIKPARSGTTRSALSGVENIDTTFRARGNGMDEGSKQTKGKTKTTTRVPKTATVNQSRPANKQPLPTAKSEVAGTHRSVTTRAGNAAAAAHKVPVTRKTRSQATSTITEVPTEQFGEMKLTEDPDVHISRRYVTTRSRTTKSTRDTEATRSTAHVPHKAKKPTKMTIHPPLAEKTNNTTHSQIEKFAPQGKSGPPEEEVDPQSIGRELVPHEPVADIDLTTDPSLCGEYAGDIYTYHRQLEEQGHYLVCATFLNHQKDINSAHRRMLVDWLAQVHYKYHLLQETMFLTVDILDRYLQVWV